MPNRLTVPETMAEVIPMTIGYEPPNPLFVYGRHGGGVASSITRIFLFGEPADPKDVDAQRGAGLITGQETWPGGGYSTGKVLQGFEVKVNGTTVVFSREVVAACSKGHLDQGAVEAMTNSLRLLAEKCPEDLGDALVSLHQIVAGLLYFPTVGYKVNPAIQVPRDARIEVRGLPVGMRLFLTGNYLREIR